jgi:polygalacturonase
MAERRQIYEITRFGAIGDGQTPSTWAIQAAIDACAHGGGGVVLAAPGVYLSGALFLRSHVHLHVMPGATLLASDRFQDFPPILSRSEGIERQTYASLITGQDLDDVVITGGGVLDGQGPPWWKAYQTTRAMRDQRKLRRQDENPAGAPLRWPRPRVVNLLRCRDVLISELSIREGPYWNIHLVYCQDVEIDALTMTGLHAQNIDGIIIDSCQRVRIANCAISSGSDPIALKSGYNEDGRRVGIPCQDVVVTNCNLSFSVGAGISLGSETAGGIRNVSISNCSITRSRYGIHVRSPRGRGGVVEGLRVSNLVLDEIAETALMITHFYDSVQQDSMFGAGPRATGNPETDRTISLPVGEGTPSFRDLDFTGLSVGTAGLLAVIEGLPEQPIRGVAIRDVRVTEVTAGVYCARAADVTIDGVQLQGLQGAAVAARQVERLQVHRLVCARPSAGGPCVQLEEVAGAFVHRCQVGVGVGAVFGSGSDGFVQLLGERNRGVRVLENDLVDPGPRCCVPRVLD